MSAIFGVGKVRFMNICKKILADVLQIFSDENSTADEVKLAGTKIFQWIYSDFPTTSQKHSINYGIERKILWMQRGKLTPSGYHHRRCRTTAQPESIFATSGLDGIEMLFQGSFKLWIGKHYPCGRANNRDDKSYSTRRHAETGIVFLQKKLQHKPMQLCEERRELCIIVCWVPRRLLQHGRRELGS